MKDPLILAIPRGGVVVGYEVAKEIHAELDVVVPRKIGAPLQPELALGATMHDGSVFLNDELVHLVGASQEYIEEEKARQMEEATRRLRAYRGDRTYPELDDRCAIIVDDGIATGATVIASSRWLRKKRAKRVIIASPVAPPDTLEMLRREADEVICPYTPESFVAIGQFYERFEQVQDDEVISILRKAWERK